MMTDQDDQEELAPVSEKFTLEQAKNSDVKVTHKYTLGSLDNSTYCVRFCPNDKYIAQGVNDGTIRIYNLYTGKCSFMLNTEMEKPMPTMSIRWRPNKSMAVTKNVIIAINANGACQHWHTTSGKLLHTIFDELNGLLSVDYNPDGTQFCTGGTDCIVRVYDETTRDLIVALEGGGSGEPGHSNRVFCTKFCHDEPNIIVSGGWDNNIKFWDIRNPSPIRSIHGPFISGDTIDIHDGYLLVGSLKDTKNLQLFDFGSCEPIEDLMWNEGLPSENECLMYGTQFQKTTGDLIIAGGVGANRGVNEVKLFDGNIDFKPCAKISQLSRPCYSVDFSNSGDQFAIGGGDGVIRVFNIVNEI